MNFSKLKDLWNGRLDGLVQYFSPFTFRCFAYVNKECLEDVRNYYTRIALMSPPLLKGDMIKKKECTKYSMFGDEKAGSWMIDMESPFFLKYLLKITHLSTQLNRETIIFRPVSYIRKGNKLCLYGWVIDDAKVEIYGPYPLYFTFDDYYDNMFKSINKIISYR